LATEQTTAVKPSPAPVLAVKDLSFGWSQPLLFDRLSFQAPAGVGLVIGDDGCGKSTLFSLLAGARTAQSGHLSLSGVVFSEAPSSYRQQVFWIDPQTDAHHGLTAEAFWAEQGRCHPLFDAGRLAALVDGFSMREHIDKPLYMLSTGSRRKVWWIAALASGAPLVLLDQPFAALDGPSARFLTSCLQKAASNPRACWLLAGHVPPENVPLSFMLEL
jgi:ABC-type multidrug transport system ATPase subunit